MTRRKKRGLLLHRTSFSREFLNQRLDVLEQNGIADDLSTREQLEVHPDLFQQPLSSLALTAKHRLRSFPQTAGFARALLRIGVEEQFVQFFARFPAILDVSLHVSQCPLVECVEF